MNNLPFNNFNILQNLATIRANILAQTETSAPVAGLVQNQTQAQTPLLNQTLAQTQQNLAGQQTFLSQNLETILNEPTLLDKTKLENQQVLKYLQNSMKMPETIEKFIQEITKQNITESTIEKFLKSIKLLFLSVDVFDKHINQYKKISKEPALPYPTGP